MKTLKIIATLVPAERSNLFTTSGVLFESVSIFYKKNGVFKGPRFLENEYADEVEQYLKKDFFYIIKFKKEYHPGEYSFKLKLRQADMDDFQWCPNFQRSNRVYYIDLGDRKVKGPLYYMSNSDKELFNKRLSEGKILVPAEGQTLQPVVQSIAS